MHKWTLALFAVMFVLAIAPASQASPLLPGGPLATVAADGNDAVLVHHKRGHWNKKHKRHYGWVRGKHKGWSHSRHRHH
jgi:hypothetical protein